MRKSVWVIDDDDIFQLIIQKLIKRSGIFEEQKYYKSAIQALKEIEKSEISLPHVILLDINMPQMDGWQFIDKLRDLNEDLLNQTSIYIVSSSIAYSDRERAESYHEVSGFISKPMTIEKLKKIGEDIKKAWRRDLA